MKVGILGTGFGYYHAVLYKKNAAIMLSKFLVEMMNSSKKLRRICRLILQIISTKLS